MDSQRIGYKQHLIEYYLPFYYLLSLYTNILVIGLGNVILVLLALAKFRGGKIIIRKELKFYLPFILWVFIRNLSKIIFTGSTTPAVNAAIFMILFAAFFVLELQPFEEDRLYAAWKFAGIIYSIGLLYHLVLIYSFRIPVRPISIIPGYALGGANIISYRPCSFFSEPAAFASAMLPLVFLANRRKSYKVSFFASIMILASTSTVGCILLAVLWLHTVTVSGLKSKIKVILWVSFIGVLVYVVASPVFVPSFQKLNGVLAGEGTFGARVAVGFGIISTMNPWQWIFGTNAIDVSNYVSQHISELSSHQTVMAYYYAKRLFLNSFSALFYHYGIIGFVLYFRTIIKRLLKPGYLAKGFLLMHIVALLGQSTLLNSLFFQTIFLLSFYDVAKQDDINIAEYNSRI